MTKRFIRYISLFILFLTVFSVSSYAQFKEEAFSQTYRSDTTSVADTSLQMISFKELFGGLAHKQEMRIGTMFFGSVILPGSAQIYNRQYWKLPIIYGGIGALAGTGGYYLHKYNQSKKHYDRYAEIKLNYENLHGTEFMGEVPFVDEKAKQTGTWLLAGAGLLYWGSMMDGAINYRSDKDPDPGRATIYSALLPGLGQIYNGELFKAPIYWGLLLGSAHFWVTNNTNYLRFKRIYSEASSPEASSDVPIPAETAKWYRDVYRRYRDYSVVATVLVYVLQIIDANVFAFMNDFEVSDDISMNMVPTVITPYNEYAMNTSPTFGYGQNAVGLKLALTF